MDFIVNSLQTAGQPLLLLLIIIIRAIHLSMLFGVRKKDTGVPGDIWFHLENRYQFKMSLLKSYRIVCFFVHN